MTSRATQDFLSIIILLLCHLQSPELLLFCRLNAEEELCQVIEESPGVGVVIFTSGVLEVAVALVVEHLVGRQVHGRVQ